MIRYNQIKISAKLPLEKHRIKLTSLVASKLNINTESIRNLTIIKRSIDARKDDINYVYCVDFETSVKVKLPKNNPNISYVEDKRYTFPGVSNINIKPVIIGLGPAGLFCAYMLVKNGIKPVIYERGKCIEERAKDVEEFWKTGVLNTASNVQFGEGGAGTFSDGKLNTLVKDKSGRNKEVLRILVEFGAPEEILYDNKPHIGTDVLKTVVSNMTAYIKAHGGEIHYNSCVDGFISKEDQLIGLTVNGKKVDASQVVLAIGHSARDTFEILNNSKVDMQPKAFAVGYRVMHPQDIIDNNQYGEHADYNLPVSSYKVTSNFERGVYSFCMCPGGYVVNASSEEGRLAVNGMSYHNRDSKVANSAIIVQVTPQDFESDDVLGGMYWQRKLEEKAFQLANGKIPLQRYGDFRKIVSPEIDGEAVLDFEPACKGLYNYCDITDILPDSLNKSFVKGMEYFGSKIKHFNDGNAIMAGIESRTSSPVRINRDEHGESSIKGLYPCGEGAGYAGGITSAAMDGIYIAECITK